MRPVGAETIVMALFLVLLVGLVALGLLGIGLHTMVWAGRWTFAAATGRPRPGWADPYE